MRTALKPSRLLAAILAAVHAGALCLVLLIEIGWIVKVALCVLLVLQCAVALRRALLRGPAAAVAFEISADDVLSIETRSAGWSEQSVLASTFVEAQWGARFLSMRRGKPSCTIETQS